MNESVYESIRESTDLLKISPYASGVEKYIEEEAFDERQLEAVCGVLQFMRKNKQDYIVDMFLRTSRLPLKEPKTFKGFDFSRVHGKDVERLKALPTLSAVYAHKNLAFIGSPGIGKTHLAQAYGRACCENRMKAYFLKASELNQKLVDAVKYGREGSTINGLVRPECLIIDEIGHCVFNEESTRLFFDVVDRRYNREGTNTMIFTSNTVPNQWKQYFTGDQSLLCSLDRIFDNATVFMMKGESYRGQHCETIAVEVGRNIGPAN